MTTDKLKKYVLPNLPYLLIFWFSDKLGEAWWLAAGTDFSAKLAGTTKTINTVFASPAPSLDPRDLLAGLAGAAIVFAVVYIKGKNAKKYRKNVEYGSARWLTSL